MKSGGISKDIPVLSGVPQGTVLEPLHLSSLASLMVQEFIQIYDCDNLQYDLNSIYNWTVHNNMFF